MSKHLICTSHLHISFAHLICTSEALLSLSNRLRARGSLRCAPTRTTTTICAASSRLRGATLTRSTTWCATSSRSAGARPSPGVCRELPQEAPQCTCTASSSVCVCARLTQRQPPFALPPRTFVTVRCSHNLHMCAHRICMLAGARGTRCAPTASRRASPPPGRAIDRRHASEQKWWSTHSPIQSRAG
eukprot:5548927-Prymnesium_polylepis.1